MRKPRIPRRVAAGLIALMPLSVTGYGTEPPQEHSPQKAQMTPEAGPLDKVRRPVYQPPRRGAPITRVGGGSRGEGDHQPDVYVLVPEHTGLTTKPQPDLFWYTSGSTAARLEFALIDDRSVDPLLETALDPTAAAGVQRIRLAEHGIVLSPGLEYQWSIALVPEPGQRSRDLVTTGRIEHVPLSPRLAKEVNNAAPTDLPLIYAREGLWYDALAALSELIAAAPANATLREQRADLLEQVGLRDVAAAERQPSR